MTLYILRDCLTGRYVGMRDCAADVELVEDINYAVTFESQWKAEQAHSHILQRLPRAVLGVEVLPEEEG